MYLWRFAALGFRVLQDAAILVAELRVKRVDVLHVNMAETEMSKFHRRKLENEFRLTRFVLVSNFFDLAQNKRLHFDGMKAEAF